MKAEVAARFVNERIQDVKVEYSSCAIQDKDASFFRQFNLVIGGLDSISGRRYLNSLLVNLVQIDEDGNLIPDTIIPYIDGGSEAFKGQVRVILPRLTSCFECSIETFPTPIHFPLCTVAETPRKPEHCIAYILFALQKLLCNPEANQLYSEFCNYFGTTEINRDDPEHLDFVFKKSLQRAVRYGIEGVTYMLTQGVIKNIIGAVSSTNAIIAASCVNEAFKILSFASQSLDTYWMYNGTQGIFSYTFRYEKREGCPVCDQKEIKYIINPKQTLQTFIDQLISDSSLQLTKPSIRKPGISLYIQHPEYLRKATKKNLLKKIEELLKHGEIISIIDPVYVIPFHMIIQFKKKLNYF